MISCQEEITLDLPQSENKLVVQGAIEPGFPPYVILTTNQGYFEPINDNTYTDLFINQEDIESIKIWSIKEGIKDSIFLEMLEIEEDLMPVSFPIYTIPIGDLLNAANDPGNYNFSKAGRTYHLEIKWKNQLITAETTIPEPTPLDCLWVEKSETAQKDFKYDIRAVYSDPAEIQNNILIQSKRLEHWKIDSTSCCTSELCYCNDTNYLDSVPDPRLILIDAGPDVLINGQSFETYFPRPRDEGGIPSGSYNTTHYKTRNNNGTIDSLLIPHDIVLIKFCQIDEISLKFWRGVVRQFTTNGNPFSEPMNLPSNINGGLGVWTGYGAAYYKIPIIKDIVIKNEYDSLSITDIF